LKRIGHVLAFKLEEAMLEVVVLKGVSFRWIGLASHFYNEWSIKKNIFFCQNRWHLVTTWSLLSDV